MANGENNGRSTTIIVAIVGVLGVLGAALISNWDKMFPRKDQAALSEHPIQDVVQPPVERPNTTAVGGNTGAANSHPEAPIASPAADDNRDLMTVLSISPTTDNVLSSQGAFSVSLRLRYRLVSADTMILVPSIEQYGVGDKCISGNHRTIGGSNPSQIPITRGEREITVLMTVPFHPHLDLGNSGYVSARASYWSGFDAEGHVIINIEELWGPSKYCYRFGPT